MPEQKVKRLAMSRKPTERGKHWTDRDKLKAIAAFAVLGNASRVEDVTGIPANTINYWKTLPWWFEEMEKLRKSEDEALVSGYTKILMQTMEKLEKRISDGDIVLLKDGSSQAVPVKAKDLAGITGILSDRRHRIRTGGSTDQTKTITMQDRLKNLEAQFTKFVTTKVVDGEVTFKDIEPSPPSNEAILDEDKDAQFKELQEGLCSGEENGDSSPEESPGSEECRPPEHDQARESQSR